MVGGIIRLLLALAGCVALLCGAPAYAQKGVAGRELAVCVLRDTGGMDPAALLRQPGRFDCTTAQHHFGPGDFWVISQDIDQPSLPQRALNVRVASLWQRGLTLHVLYADGTIATQTTDARGVTPLIQLGAIVEQPLPPRAARVVRLLWHVEGSTNLRGILLGARLSTAQESTRANLAMAGLYAGFAGLSIALIIYNLALWGALRHRFQLYYCLMVGLLLAYTFSSSGALAWAWPDIVNNTRLRTNFLLLGGTGTAALVFARSFFEERVFAGWLGRYATVVGFAMAGVGLLYFLTAPFAVRWTDLAFTCSFVALAAAVFPLLWRAWRLRSNYLWLFAFAWGAPILTAALRALANLHLIQWGFWIDNSTILAMMIEAVVSSLAVAYRIRLLRDERDDAIEREVMMRRLADTDPLTGLLNRRAFLQQAIGRTGEQLLLIIDLDHFKRVNETLGHDGGDEVLRVFARMLRTSVPQGTLVARIGGEEFAILTPVDKPIEPEAVLARLRQMRMPFDLQVTASIGTCRGTLASEVEWKALYRIADAALFDAKSAGRDRVRNALREAA
ncbi:GGDEF domain-containing protein [Sphingomonas psychrotolerans]|uniref:diguanylate cyclase n=1 Tax=Sphingomonas psychrotolerans TaxID=1327635 RepID=A0ABU3N3Z5_9SPHN|nr:diguanylate cyclase [Sphingomonas psychrotolerans]MDT8759244.1 GGDEF domain-containing protein [Sphingomonas psychrotolerans]